MPFAVFGGFDWLGVEVVLVQVVSPLDLTKEVCVETLGALLDVSTFAEDKREIESNWFFFELFFEVDRDLNIEDSSAVVCDLYFTSSLTWNLCLLSCGVFSFDSDRSITEALVELEVTAFDIIRNVFFLRSYSDKGTPVVIRFKSWLLFAEFLIFVMISVLDDNRNVLHKKLLAAQFHFLHMELHWIKFLILS